MRNAVSFSIHPGLLCGIILKNVRKKAPTTHLSFSHSNRTEGRTARVRGGEGGWTKQPVRPGHVSVSPGDFFVVFSFPPFNSSYLYFFFNSCLSSPLCLGSATFTRALKMTSASTSVYKWRKVRFRKGKGPTEITSLTQRRVCPIHDTHFPPLPRLFRKSLAKISSTLFLNFILLCGIKEQHHTTQYTLAFKRYTQNHVFPLLDTLITTFIFLRNDLLII